MHNQKPKPLPDTTLVNDAPSNSPRGRAPLQIKH
jgi:hypothetical protein